MDPREFCSQSRVVIVAGKGGVGKTTVSAALARMAAGAGLSALVVEVDSTGGLAAAFGSGERLGYEERVLAPGVNARVLTADVALVEYLDGHGLARLSRRLLRSGALDVVATAAPGIKDILVLGKVKQLEREGVADLIVLDAPATGHALTFLQSAAGLLEVVRAGPLRSQSEDVAAMLADPRRCQVVLVTLPEEMPVNETVETAFALEDRVGVNLGPVVVNGLYPALGGLDADPEEAAGELGASLRPGEAGTLSAAGRHRWRRQELQRAQVERLARALPLPQVHLPWLFTVDLGPSEVDVLAGALASGVGSLEVAR